MKKNIKCLTRIVIAHRDFGPTDSYVVDLRSSEIK